MDILPSHVKFFWKTSEYAINFYIFICLVIMILAICDIYKCVFKRKVRSRLLYIRILVYIISLVIVSTISYFQYIETFRLNLSDIEQVEMDVRYEVAREPYHSITELEEKREIIQILKEYEYRLSWINRISYKSSDEILELRICSVENRRESIHIIMNPEKIIMIYTPGSEAVIIVLSDHREL